jgi:hypothetical protein
LSYIILRSSIIALGRQLRLLFKAWPAKKNREIYLIDDVFSPVIHV